MRADNKNKNYVLNDKQANIFKLIVETYIQTGEPIGSQKLVEKCDLSCSSATIRNIMAYLEKLEFLEKQHISGGRIPSTKGLEFYAKYLVYNPKKYFNEKLDDLLAKRRLNIDTTLDEAASVISKMANFTVIATTNNASETLKSIQLTPLNENSSIVVLVKVAIRLFKERLIDIPLIKLSEKANALMPIFQAQVKNYEIIMQKFIKTIFVFEEETHNKTYNKGAIILSENISREDIAKVFELIEKHSVWEAIENNLDEDNNIKLDLSRPNLSIISKKINFNNSKNIKEISVVGPSNINFEESFETINILEKLIDKEKNNEN